jgi:5'-3' exonuclease
MGVRKLFVWVKGRFGYLLLRSRTKTVRYFPKSAGGAPQQGRVEPQTREEHLTFVRYKVDGNALLHPAAQWTYGYGEFKGNQQGIPDFLEGGGEASGAGGVTGGGLAKRVPNPDVKRRQKPTPELAAERLIFLIEEGWTIIDPDHRTVRHLYVAIDGPAPLAKAQQQRTRRFLTAARNASEEASKDDVDTELAEGEVPTGGGIGGFDSAVISPGTEWMDRVDLRIRRWLRENVARLPKDTVYWSHRNPGEGEHKLIATSITKDRGGRRGECDAIYGNDNDLIILAMLRTSNTYILRDALDRKDDVNLLRNPSRIGRFCLLDVEGLKDRLRRVYEVTPEDFGMVALLLGNDFVPTTPAGLDVYGTLDGVLKLYSEIKAAKRSSRAGQQNPTYALFTDRVQWDDLYVLINALAKPEREAQMLAGAYALEKRSNDAFNEGSSRTYDDGTPRRVIEKTAALWSSVIVTPEGASVDVDRFRDLYWRKVFPGLERSPEQGEVVTSVVDHYLQVIVWSASYYAYGTSGINVEFFYPYYYAPTMVEVRDVMRAFRTEATSRWEALPLDKTARFLNPLELQVAILPLPILNRVLYGTDELEDELRDRVFGPLRDLYPDEVEIDGEGQDLLDKAVVRLPFVDAYRVREVARTLRRPDIARVERLPLKYPFEDETGRGKAKGRA